MRARMRRGRGSQLPSVMATVAALLAFGVSGSASWAAGTAYGVDTAEVSDPGNCKIEGWLSQASNGDRVATANPACVVDFGTPTEVSVQIQRARDAGDWATSYSPKIKAKLTQTGIGKWGFSAVAGVNYDATANDVSGAFAYVPATLRLSEIVRINVNLGWQLDATADRHFASYGVGFDWILVEKVIFTGEMFGIVGNSETANETRPRFQAGLRYRPEDRYSIDLIYGHNINGEGADWITLATTVRFPPN